MRMSLTELYQLLASLYKQDQTVTTQNRIAQIHAEITRQKAQR